ncbi:MAG: cadherin repeat domain-containing protein, partial [Myxococcales bacterium]|nr:cadherin repeat domain-containing protein [Myxococcales bacterium]
VERLELAGQALTVSAREVARLSRTSNRLVVTGTGTVTTAPGDRWRASGDAVLDGVSYVTLRAGEVSLWLALGLATVVPPTALDEAPRVVPENSAVGAAVATLDAVDPDGDDAALSWEVLEDPSGAFTVDEATGALVVADAGVLDFEAGLGPWTVRVVVTDEDGLATEGRYVVEVGDEPEAPVFVTDAPRWSAEEDAAGVLGSVAAVDEDADDNVSYAIVADPASLFTVDAETGAVSLRDGAHLDYETATTETLTVRATDTTGLTDDAVVTIDVLDRETLEQHARVTFELRGWSIWQDGTASSFDGFGFEGFTDEQVASTCVSEAPGDEAHSESWTSRFAGWGAIPVALPFRMESQFLGRICTYNELTYDEGTMNATVPVDIDLTVPDEIVAGQTITIGSTATPTYEGAALWGKTTGLDIRWSLELDDVGLYMAMCDDLITHSCGTIVNKSGLTGTYDDHFGRPAKPWRATGQLDEAGRWALTTEAPAHVDTLAMAISWDDYIYSALSFLGLPSNTGRYEATLEDAGGHGGSDVKVRFDYTVLHTEAGFLGDASWDFDLEVYGVDAVLTFENGAETSFRVGEPVDVLVPADADADHDGKVDVTFAFTLDSQFHNTWDHLERAGYFYTGGFGRFRLIDDDGFLLAERQVGPAFEKSCVPKVSETGGVTGSCYVSHAVDEFTFAPTGWTSAPLRGALDLGSP